MQDLNPPNDERPPAEELPTSQDGTLSPSPPPPPAQPAPPRMEGLATAALITAILSLCPLFGFLLAIPALVLGIVSLVAVKRSEGRLTGKGSAIAAICVSGFALVAGAVFTYPIYLHEREGAWKATCISNTKQIALAALIYAQDYDETLPPCVASDTQGTAHAVGGLYANRARTDFVRDVKARYGEQYVDGRWMWQLADMLAPYVKLVPYLRNEDVFDCPMLTRFDRRFRLQTYVVGTDKRTGRPDPHDPIRPYIPGKRKTKVWQSGSYLYMCAHHPFGAGVKARPYGAPYDSEQGIAIFALWDVANLVGIIGAPAVLDAADPQDRLACSNCLSSIADPVRKPLLACDSFGLHYYKPEYLREHIVPPKLERFFGSGGLQPTLPVETPMAFADGHIKYWRGGLQETLLLLFRPNSSTAPVEPFAPGMSKVGKPAAGR